MRLIDADALRAEYQAILDRGDMFCEYDIIGMVDDAPTVERKPFASFTFDKDELEQIVRDRVIEPIKNGELVVKREERPHGEWIDHSGDEGYLECPICGCLTTCECNKEELHYCWNCGADLRGDNNE